MATYNGVNTGSTPRLDAICGYPRDRALVIRGKLDAAVNIGGTNQPLYAGSVVYVSSVVAGTPPQPVFSPGATTTKMPIFLWAGTDGYDVSNPGVPPGVILGGTTNNPPAWIPVFPTGTLFGLVATGGYELESDQFDTAQTYLVNDPLRAVTSNSDANAGKLSNKGNSGGGAPGFTSSSFLAPPAATSDTVVGIVSRGKYVNKYGRTVLAFWTYFALGTR